MKKILICFILLFSLTAIKAQDDKPDHIVRKGEIYEIYRPTAADTILNTATWDYIFYLGEKDKPQLYSIGMQLDSISGTPAHTITTSHGWDLDDFDTFDNLDTISWGGTAVDTSFSIEETSTGTQRPYFRVLVTGSATSKSQLTMLKWRFLDDNSN